MQRLPSWVVFGSERDVDADDDDDLHVLNMHIYSAIPAEWRGKDKAMHKKSSSSLSQECEGNQSNCALSEGIF